MANKQNFNHFKNPSCKGAFCRVLPHFVQGSARAHSAKKSGKNPEKRQIADMSSSKNVVETGVFYYWFPFVTLGDLGCNGLEAGRHTEVFSF